MTEESVRFFSECRTPNNGIGLHPLQVRIAMRGEDSNISLFFSFFFLFFHFYFYFFSHVFLNVLLAAPTPRRVMRTGGGIEENKQNAKTESGSPGRSFGTYYVSASILPGADFVNISNYALLFEPIFLGFQLCQLGRTDFFCHFGPGVALLKVGGKLIYSTCSLNPIENEAVVGEVRTAESAHGV